MLPLPQVAEPLLMSLSIAFTQPTFNRILVLIAESGTGQGASYDHVHPVDRARTGSGALDRLPPRFQPGFLVVVSLGTSARRRNRAVASRRPDRRGHRRYDGPASREEGLRQGMPPRRSSVDAHPYRLSLGTQMGRTGHRGEIPFHQSTVGVAGFVCLVSPSRTQ